MRLPNTTSERRRKEIQLALQSPPERHLERPVVAVTSSIGLLQQLSKYNGGLQLSPTEDNWRYHHDGHQQSGTM